MADEILYQVQEGLGVLTINRPQARNAFNWVAQEQFAAAVAAAGRDPELRVLIVTAAGDQAFAAGGDLKELIDHPETASGERLQRVMTGALVGLTELPVPVIAAVNGDAIGGGCEIITACDLCAAAAQARFRFAQIQVALTTGWGGTGRLVHLIGQSRALELLLTGRTFDVDEALRIGFIHRIVPDGQDVLIYARRWAAELAELPRQALAATKRLAQAAGRFSLPEIYQLEARLFADLWPQPDHLEAMAAFVEKRRPLFNQPLARDDGRP